MVRGIGWCGLAKIAVVFSVLLVLHGLVTRASPQASDSAALAKVHYQNAVAAQSKGDWQTAKSELLQAEKLAPQNALVHYDLALAYSHTGQVNSAQTEATKALQLGLPAEQKKAAEDLRQQLGSQANTSSGSGAKQKSSQGPRVAEILDWVKDTTASEAHFDKSANDTANRISYDSSDSYKIENIQGCRFTWVAENHNSHGRLEGEPDDMSKYDSTRTIQVDS